MTSATLVPISPGGPFPKDEALISASRSGKDRKHVALSDCNASLSSDVEAFPLRVAIFSHRGLYTERQEYDAKARNVYESMFFFTSAFREERMLVKTVIGGVRSAL